MEECIQNCIGLDSSAMHRFGEEQDSGENKNALSGKR